MDPEKKIEQSAGAPPIASGAAAHERAFERVSAGDGGAGASTIPATPLKRRPGRPAGKKTAAKGPATAKAAGERAPKISVVAPARVASPTTTAAAEQRTFTADVMKPLLRAAGFIEAGGAWAVMRAIRKPVEFADLAKIWTFTPAELDKIAGPAADVCELYLPDLAWFAEHAELLELGSVLFQILGTKVLATIALADPAGAARARAAVDAIATGKTPIEFPSSKAAPVSPVPAPAKPAAAHPGTNGAAGPSHAEPPAPANNPAPAAVLEAALSGSELATGYGV
jgi:hypothetical protein